MGRPVMQFVGMKMLRMQARHVPAKLASQTLNNATLWPLNDDEGGGGGGRGMQPEVL